jgi:RNA polymerase sigma-70 factor (ECF subfamily)
MSELTEAERYLLESIRQGDADAWSQLVQRYQGRLLAFAHGRMRRSADAEDLVQETFLAFLKGLAAFRGQANLETYLFTILRRKIIPTGQYGLYNPLTPLLARLETWIRPPIGLSVVCVAKVPAGGAPQ